VPGAGVLLPGAAEAGREGPGEQELSVGGDDDADSAVGLRWQGDPGNWAIGIYKASTGQYTESELPASFGGAAGTPEQGIDETFTLYVGPRTGN
jgi:hypothetical protein